MATTRKTVAVTLGDPAGVGPEIAMKTALDPRVRERARIVLFGDRRALDLHAERCGIRFPYRVHATAGHLPASDDETPLVHVDSLGDGLRLGEVAAHHGAAAVAALDAAVAAALAGDVDAVIGAPIHELAIKQAGIAFDGHPSYLARRTGTPLDEVFLMLCWGRQRVVHATLHLSVREALDMLTQPHVVKVIRAADKALRKLGIAQPRIGVSGVNPHAGEAGMFGREEIETIGPAVDEARRAGIDVIGPIGADTLLPRTDCDAFVVMLHDQGHVPAKLAATHTVAALSVGTPVVFSSVGHGTAMDIAGRNQANPEAMVQAVWQVTNTHNTPDTGDLR
jgi:4-hydroxythreonine-4-phosphate dehydrogenase